jgi:hypothetical protein
MQVFTDENFKGYEFRCTSASANTGFKHICEVYKDNNPIDSCLSVVNWGNRTWESFPYATVLQDSKDKLTNLLDGIEKPEIDYDFLYKLVEHDIITDYGELENGETVILMDSWSQVEGSEERTYNEETNRMEKTGNFIKSPYAKLKDLAEKGLLKPSVQSTIVNVDYVFTDEYMKCDECGKVYNYYYGDLTYSEEEGIMLCDNCINSPERVESLIERAKEDFRKALKPTVDQSIIEGLGYSLIEGDTFSFAQDRYFVNNTTEEWVDKFIHKYNGFVQIYQVEQFDCPFQIWVPSDVLENAQREVNFKYNYN